MATRFYVVELLTVITIIGILISLLLPAVQSAQKRQDDCSAVITSNSWPWQHSPTKQPPADSRPTVGDGVASVIPIAATIGISRAVGSITSCPTWNNKRYTICNWARPARSEPPPPCKLCRRRWRASCVLPPPGHAISTLGDLRAADESSGVLLQRHGRHGRGSDTRATAGIHRSASRHSAPRAQRVLRRPTRRLNRQSVRRIRHRRQRHLSILGSEGSAGPKSAMHEDHVSDWREVRSL